MKNKIITINKEEYKLLLSIKTEDNEYIIYTKNEVNDCNDIICYVSSYEFVDGLQILNPVDEDILETIDTIFMQVQNVINKKESSEE